MEYEELWSEIAKKLDAASNQQDALQVGVNIIAAYLDMTQSDSVVLKMKNHTMTISMEPNSTELTDTHENLKEEKANLH